MNFEGTRNILPKMTRMDTFEIWKKYFEFVICFQGFFSSFVSLSSNEVVDAVIFLGLYIKYLFSYV